MKKYIFLFTLIFSILQISAQKVIDRTTAPVPSAARTPEIASYESFTLKNGLKVFVVENHKLPRITMRLILDRDPIVEGDKAGYVQIAGDLISAGTKSKTKAELDEAIDFMGAGFSTSSSSITANGLSKYTDKLLGIFSDVLLNPRFSESEFSKLKGQMISGIKSSEDNADAMSQKLTQASIYGLEHPYGEVLTEATVNSIKLEDCKSYWETYFRPNIGYMVIIGDITLEDAKKKISKTFKKWKKKPVPKASYKKTTLPKSSRVLLVNKPSAVQSLIWIGNVINLTPGHPDIEPLRIANKILGGGASGRLFINIREDKGYTYGAYSNFGVDRLNSTFSASAKVRNEVTDSAIVEFLNEYEKITTEKVTELELKAAKSRLKWLFWPLARKPLKRSFFRS
jgi:predicted Zn-dependent peptidase